MRKLVNGWFTMHIEVGRLTFFLRLERDLYRFGCFEIAVLADGFELRIYNSKERMGHYRYWLSTTMGITYAGYAPF